MQNSCLYPFYEYIINAWVQPKLELPRYEEVFSDSKRFLEVNSEMENRKRIIWEATRQLLAISESERLEKVKQFQNGESDCTLCVSCTQCEKNYWKQLELALTDHEGNINCEKCEFLVPNEINELLEQKDRPVDLYWDFYKRRSNIFEDKFLVMLKGFSSSTPILLNSAKNTNFYGGGGFFLKWNGLGIVVDPGYLFVQNLHNYGLSVLDIDVVVVTHEHIDHSSDVRLLDDLHYSVASNCKEKDLGWKQQEFVLTQSQTPAHTIKWYLDHVTYEKALLFQKTNSGFDPQYNELYCVSVDEIEHPKVFKKWENDIQISPADTIKLNDHVSLSVFATRHEQYGDRYTKSYFEHTFGCVFECCDPKQNKISIGYTSDTSIQPEIYQRMHELLIECQVIISNISGIYKEDVLLQTGKERHLGYYGSYRLVGDLISEKDCKLRYYLLSEFANQVSDIRYSVSKYMQKEINKLVADKKRTKIAVIPTEVGLTVDLSVLRVRCTSCDKYSEQIHVLKPAGENYNLQYVCSECIFSDEG